MSNRISGCGASPDADELWRWMHGECNPVRAKEIRTHLAADEELYELWQSFRREIAIQHSGNSTFKEERATAASAMRSIQDNPDNRNTSSSAFFSWLSGWPAGAVAYAAVATLLFTVLLPHLPHSVPAPEQYVLWQQWRVSKSTPVKLSDQSYRSGVQPFLVGVRTALIAIGAEAVDPENRPLPAEYLACTVSDAECLQRQVRLLSLGELSVGTVFRCVTGNAAVDVPETLFDVQASVMSSQTLSPFHAP